jgi:hypothetical protein
MVPRQPWMRSLGLYGLVTFLVADLLLIALAIRHARSHDSAVVAIGPSSAPAATQSTAPSPARGASISAILLAPASQEVAAASYGSCRSGYATVAGERVSARAVLAVAGAPASVLVGRDSGCAVSVSALQAGVWKRLTDVDIPDGVLAGAQDAIWAIGKQAGLVLNTRGAVLSRPTDPCLRSPLQLVPSFVAASSTRQAAVFCTRPATAAGQVRLVYGTQDGGTTWAEYAGARAVGPGAKGRKDGLDGDGTLVAAASLGGDDVAVLLSNGGCDGLQLRMSADRGRNWTVGGCLPPEASTDNAVVGGTESHVEVANVTQGTVSTWISEDGGKTWTAG